MQDQEPKDRTFDGVLREAFMAGGEAAGGIDDPETEWEEWRRSL